MPSLCYVCVWMTSTLTLPKRDDKARSARFPPVSQINDSVMTCVHLMGKLCFTSSNEMESCISYGCDCSKASDTICTLTHLHINRRVVPIFIHHRNQKPFPEWQKSSVVWIINHLMELLRAIQDSTTPFEIRIKFIVFITLLAVEWIIWFDVMWCEVWELWQLWITETTIVNYVRQPTHQRIK